MSDEDELVLVTAPVSSTSEVQALYSAGIIDWQSAIPATLHSLGCSATEITDALTRRKELESTQTNEETGDQSKADKADKADKDDKADKADKADTDDKADKADKVDKMDKADLKS